jgi:hypothetical protein
MKTLLALSALLLANNALAADLPQNMRDLFGREIAARCAVSSVKEGSTSFRAEKYDQGLFDHFYTTSYTAQYLFDGAHPVTTVITVNGIVDAATGASEVLEVKADVDGACR